MEPLLLRVCHSSTSIVPHERCFCGARRLGQCAAAERRKAFFETLALSWGTIDTILHHAYTGSCCNAAQGGN
jgi:hypothetical protein